MTFTASPFPRVKEIGARILALQALFAALGFVTTTLDTALKALTDNDGNFVLPNGYSTSEANLQAAFETRAEIAEQALSLYEVAWAQASGAAGQVIPTGTVIESYAKAAPTGFLLCDGTAVSRTTYALLLAAITITTNATHSNGSPVLTGIASTTGMQAGDFVSGVGIPAGAKILTVDSGVQITLDANATAATPLTGPITVSPFGIGDGTTTFNVPDRRGRAAIGAGTGSGLTARLLGQNVGAETVTLSGLNLPISDVADGGNTGHLTTGVAGTPAVGAGGPTVPTAVNKVGPSIGANFFIKT